jgi:hypothetical protein
MKLKFVLFPWSTNGECYKNDRIKTFDEIIKVFCRENELSYLHMFDLLENQDLFD